MDEDRIVSTRGALTITRVAADGGDYIEVKVVDARSYKKIIAVGVPMAEFAAALTGLGAQDCDVEYFPSEHIGKREAVKQLAIEIPDDPDWFPYSAVMGTIRQHEVDGWIADLSKDITDARYHFRNEESGKRCVWITYRRYVDVD